MAPPALSHAHRTKIICTMGPSTASIDTVRSLIEAGTDIFRLNMSHGDYEAHSRDILNVRKAARELNRHVAVLLDLQGVKVRTTRCEPEPFEVLAGSEIEVAGGEDPSHPGRVTISPAAAILDLRVGNRVLIEDGKICLRATRRGASAWVCVVENGGVVKTRKGVNLPDTPSRELPALTQKDRDDIEWGVSQEVDLFALSFVRSANDVRACSSFLAGLNSDTPIIAKLEKPSAVEDLSGILQESYGVMVARGDLGVEMPPERVPILQKQIIAAARKQMKPVITATQMLDSMIERPVPTRAEVSDVANAVLDGTDAVMLSGESSVGKYPVETVRMMGRILTEAETALQMQRKPRTFSARRVTFGTAVGAAAAVAAESIKARCIIVYTHSGFSAQLLSGHRPAMPIYTFGADDATLRRLALLWGVSTRKLPVKPSSVEDLIKRCETALLQEKLVDSNDPVVIVAGMPFHHTGNTNFLKLHRIEVSG